MILIERLKEVLSYNPETGEFTWREARGQNKAGDAAGTIMPQGYRVIRIDRCGYSAHRLAWFYMTGAWPKDQIDHINLVKSDNRWSNLREASPSENARNVASRRNGKKGVTLHRDGKYQAQIKKNGVNRYLGVFPTEEAAHSAYLRAASELFGEFARAA